MALSYFEEMLRKTEHCPEAVLVTATEGRGAGAHALVSEEGYLLREDGFPAETDLSGIRREGGKWKSGDTVFFSERAGRQYTAVVCGCGHVGLRLIRILSMAGFRVICLEDRSAFGRAALDAGADQILCGSYRGNLMKIGEKAFYIIMTRGHQYDMECLETILRKDFLYAGMMGSHGRVAAAEKEMCRKGIPEEKIRLVHAPIGLEIGAETPAEIAVSAAAEIIKTRSCLERSAFPADLRKALLSQEEAVLATITGHRGSAPRKAGTKMVVFGDGRIAGTIGGGLAENDVIRTACRMLEDPDGPRFMNMELDLTGSRKEEGGLACGGITEVFLEIIRRNVNTDAGDDRRGDRQR